MLEIKDVMYYYKSQKDKVILNHISYSFEEGKMYAVLGTSGSGKTTLLSLLAGLDVPVEGEICMNGVNIMQKGLNGHRKENISLVFQNYNLIPVLNVRENMSLPVLMDGRDINEKRMEELLELLKLKNREGRLPNQLSGGQQQRVSIGRALLNAPALLLADEPTGNLDSENSREIMKLLRYSNEVYHQTIIVITHDENIALQADRILALEDGRIVKDEVIRR